MADNCTLGSGDFTYCVEPNWQTMPPGYEWREVAAVAVDGNDNVYVFNRGEHPMMVFDKDGNFVKSWARAYSRGHTALAWVPMTRFIAATTATTRCANARWTATC